MRKKIVSLKNNLFIVFNVTHLSYVVDASTKFDTLKERNVLLVFGNQKFAKTSLKLQIDTTTWHKVIFIYPWYYFLFDFLAPFKTSKWVKLKFYIFKPIIRQIKKQLSKITFERVILTNLLSSDKNLGFVLAGLNYNHFIYYDDGTSTIPLVTKINENELRLPVPDSITYFSFFNLKGMLRDQDLFIPNNLDFLRNKVQVNLFVKEVWFIGSPVYLNYCTVDEYISHLKAVKRFFINKGFRKFIYVPHRAELSQLCSLIKDDFEIKKYDKPFERVFLEDLINKPKVVASFFSSVLFTISKIMINYPIDIFAFKMNESILNSNIHSIYNYLEKDEKINLLKYDEYNK